MKNLVRCALIFLGVLSNAYAFDAVKSAQGLKPPLTASELRFVERASPYMPSLKANIDKYWPNVPFPSTLGALVEKESMWNPRAELCMPRGSVPPACGREYGFGFGQLTITPRFNVFEEVKTLHPDLRAWKFEDRFNPNYQLASVVLKNRLHYNQCVKVMNPGIDVTACGFSSYNGGFGGVLADRRVCSNTLGCDPRRWFGHVERTSLKAKEALPGYGQSFFQINRGYVRALILERPRKYSIFPGFEALPEQ